MKKNDERITFEIDRKTKKELKNYADNLGTSISFILRNLIKTKNYGAQTFRTPATKKRNNNLQSASK
jgi:hypothetical protein